VDKNLKWKTPLPGAGVSCPIVVDGKVFVTCYSGYGMDRANPGDQKNLKRHVICIDRSSGEIRWNKVIDAALPEDEFSGAGVPEHGYASHTPVSDGERVYAFLGKSGVYAFDMDGNEQWKAEVGNGSDERRWGSASSPILHGGLLIVPAIAESSAIIALKKETGEIAWKQEADGLSMSWSTPVVVKIDDNRSDLVIGVPGEIWGLNPDNGKLRWFCTGIPGDSFYTSLAVQGDMVYGSVGTRQGGGSFAVKCGGKGDVSETNLVWSGGDQSAYATPVLHDDKMYFASRGILTVLKTNDGTRIVQERMGAGPSEQRPAAQGSESQRGGPGQGGGPGQRGGAEAQQGEPGPRPQAGQRGEPGQPGGPGGQPGRRGGRGGRGGGRGGFNNDYSSPVIADDKLYYVKKSGETFVFSLTDELKQLSVNRVTQESEEFSATPAVVDGEIFIRSNKHLYCIANQ
jgi:hypothetical protein